MGRPTRKTVFVRRLLEEIETEAAWEEYRTAIYKEYILHLTTGEPRWLYDAIVREAEHYWDYMTTNVDRTLTPEELVTDMGEVIDGPLVKKTLETLNKTRLLHP